MPNIRGTVSDTVSCTPFPSPSVRITRQTFDASTSPTSKLSLSYQRSLVSYNMLIQAPNDGTFHHLSQATGSKGSRFDTCHRLLHKSIARNCTTISPKTCVLLVCFTPTWRRRCFLPWLSPANIAGYFGAIVRRTRRAIDFTS